MKKNTPPFGFSLFAIAFLLSLASSMTYAEKPNVIVILADDMGFSDIGCYGSEIETPNLDRLAAGGVKFSQFYNSGRCCPTRASLMTGLHPHETGIGWMTNPPNLVNREHGSSFPGYQGYLHRNCVTIAEVLKDAGYATLMTGKWHLGYNDKDRWPLQRGFEKYYGIIAGASNLFYPTYPRNITLGNEPIENSKSTTDRRFYVTDAFTDWGIRFIEEERADKDRPFFLYLAYTSPHWPLHAHQEEVKKYRGKYKMGWDKLREQRYQRQIELGLIDESWKLSERSHQAWDEMSNSKQDEMDYRFAYYAAMIDRMDQNIGKLIEYLKSVGEHEDHAAIRVGDWKLVGSKVSVPGTPNEKKWELYNLKDDRTETNDLSERFPDRRAEMAATWKEWAYSHFVYPKPENRTYPISNGAGEQH